MTRYDDRILDLALTEELGSEHPPDLEARILDATRKPRVLRGGVGRRPRAALAAALLVATALALAWSLWPRVPAPEVDPPPVPWARDAATGTALEPDTETRGPRRILFRSGTELDAGDGAHLKITPTGAELLGGSLVVRGRVIVVTRYGRIDVDAAAEAALALDEDELQVRVVAGSVRADGAEIAQGETWRTPPPKQPEEPKRDPAPEPLTPGEREHLDRLVRVARISVAGLDSSNPAMKTKWLEGEKAATELRSMLLGRPAAWAHVRERLQALPRAPDARQRLIGLLVDDAASRPLVLAELERDAAVFSPDAVLALAEEGEKAAHAELLRRVATLKPGIQGVPFGVFLALRGDARGKYLLEWFRGSGLGSKFPDYFIACAAGLERLGEPGWGGSISFTRRRMNAHLAKGRMDFAADRVLRLEYFARAVRSRKPVRVDRLLDRLKAYVAKHKADLGTADAIRARLEALDD
ncbi:MAG: hypothetical protein ACYTGN_06720 [Planctomycetota bacterium]|jgi:hypothetical protein